MDKPKYTKLSALIGDTFTVTKVWGFSWKKYDPSSRKMLSEERWSESMRGEKWSKVYGVETDKGKLDVRDTQLGQMLEAVSQYGKADINNRTIKVNANMTQQEFDNADKETKMKIRYYFNATLPTAPPVTEPEEEEEPFDMDSIPF